MKGRLTAGSAGAHGSCLAPDVGNTNRKVSQLASSVSAPLGASPTAPLWPALVGPPPASPHSPHSPHAIALRLLPFLLLLFSEYDDYGDYGD